MTYAVIMAGGIGSRFWPRSRKATPKQFLNVFGDATLIQNTIARLQGIVPPERCFIVTHERYTEQVKRQLPAVPEENILAEPVSRNTAPCIAYAAVKLMSIDPDATMIVLPADHLIEDVRTYHNVLSVAIEKAQQDDALVTIGITPTHPETGYGYIQFEGTVSDGGEHQAHPVKTFAEKPNLATAQRFLESGDFLWNSGMFIWKASTILDQMAQHLPEAHEAFQPLQDALGTESEAEVLLHSFQSCPRISIDYGVMERAGSVFVVPGSFGWNDVGDWLAVYGLSEKNEHGNATKGNVIMQDSKGCYVQGNDRLVALVGMTDAIVVDTKDAVLVCNKESAQKVKHVVDYLHAHQLEEFV